MADEDDSRVKRRVAAPPPPRGAPPGGPASRGGRSSLAPRGPPPKPAPGKRDSLGSKGGASDTAADDKDGSLSAVQRWRMKRMESNGSSFDGSGSARRDSDPTSADKSGSYDRRGGREPDDNNYERHTRRSRGEEGVEVDGRRPVGPSSAGSRGHRTEADEQHTRGYARQGSLDSHRQRAGYDAPPRSARHHEEEAPRSTRYHEERAGEGRGEESPRLGDGRGRDASVGEHWHEPHREARRVDRDDEGSGHFRRRSSSSINSGERQQSFDDDEDRHGGGSRSPKDRSDQDTRTERTVSSEGRAKKGKKKRRSKDGPTHADEKSELSLSAQQYQRALHPKVYDTDKIPILLKELLAFVTNPFEREQGTMLRCFIERSRGLSNAFTPVYTLYSDNENGSGRMLMAARKVLKSKTPYYVFSTNPDDLTRPRSERTRQYLGKLRGNSNCSEYILYDDGEAPDALGGEGEDDDDSRDGGSSREDGKIDRSRLRRELLVVYYNYGLSDGNPRKVEVVIPKVLHKEQRPTELLVEMWQPIGDKDSMADALRRIRDQGAQNVLQGERLMAMHQKETRYDPLSSCLVDFKGRATAASVKNFQLIRSCPEDKAQRKVYYSPTGEGRDESANVDAPVPILLQMGRVGRDCFNMDMQHPLSIFQAFAICVSRFDTKSKWS